MSSKVDLHVIMEVTPENRRSVLFDLTSLPLKAGITPAEPILSSQFPQEARNYWKDLASFHLAVFNNPKSVHLDTMFKGYAISRFIRKLRTNVILFEDISPRIALISSLLKSTPWVIGVHDPEAHSGEKNWRILLARKLMYPNAQKIILHNKAQESSFLGKCEIPQSRSAVIRLGTYDVYRHWGSVQTYAEDRNILFFGRLSPYKGLQVLLQAVSIVCQQVHNVTINIVGKPIPGYEAPVVPLLSNGGRINLIQRYVTADELACFFRKTTCVVCPYIDATQSGVILTAYAFGKPVIATRVGGLPEYILHGRTGFLVEPNNPQTLASAIILLLQEDDLRRNLEREISSIHRQSASWEEISSQYVDIFENIVMCEKANSAKNAIG
jgi:glycosyltransferase involved in cell wall biosynthesis